MWKKFKNNSKVIVFKLSKYYKEFIFLIEKNFSNNFSKMLQVKNVYYFPYLKKIYIFITFLLHLNLRNFLKHFSKLMYWVHAILFRKGEEIATGKRILDFTRYLIESLINDRRIAWRCVMFLAKHRPFTEESDRAVVSPRLKTDLIYVIIKLCSFHSWLDARIRPS